MLFHLFWRKQCQKLQIITLTPQQTPRHPMPQQMPKAIGVPTCVSSLAVWSFGRSCRSVLPLSYVLP
ncbi:hypothetical protein [Moraxella lacunata]|uniref:hypothetical protein n=1 Tax=Moraxella lacunata TaxID=477 RepID=UPI003EE21EF3